MKRTSERVVFLHIGPPKTGSTTLQRFVFPFLGIPFYGARETTNIVRNQVIPEAPCVLSSENLGGAVEPWNQWENFQKLLHYVAELRRRELCPRVLFVSRPHVDWVISAFKHCVKTRKSYTSMTLEEFAEGFLNEKFFYRQRGKFLAGVPQLCIDFDLLNHPELLVRRLYSSMGTQLFPDSNQPSLANIRGFKKLNPSPKTVTGLKFERMVRSLSKNQLTILRQIGISPYRAGRIGDIISPESRIEKNQISSSVRNELDLQYIKDLAYFKQCDDCLEVKDSSL